MMRPHGPVRGVPANDMVLTMTKLAVAALALALVSISAQAQTDAPASEKKVRFLVGAGLTFGGDKLASAEYTDGSSQELHGGGLIALYAGVEYAVNPSVSLQANIGYHVDQASADNGELRFERYPLELMAYYKVSDKWRAGAGVRIVNSPRFASSGAGDMGDFNFKNTSGAVIEAEYMASPRIGYKMRYVNEKYTPKAAPVKVDGSHFGVMANFYF